jgi:hypothetical protein
MVGQVRFRPVLTRAILRVASVVVSGPGAFIANVNNGLSANSGCTTGGTPGACFFSAPALALSNSMTWTIDFTPSSGVLDFSDPHLKVQFLTHAGDRFRVVSKHTGHSGARDAGHVAGRLGFVGLAGSVSQAQNLDL